MSSGVHSKFQNRCIAFVDILGFSDIVERMSTDDRLFKTIQGELHNLDKLSLYFQKYRKENIQKAKVLEQRGFLSLTSPSDLQMTAFSDSYVISELMPGWHVLAAVQGLGSRLLAQGILTRGGIVRGEAYHQKRIVFGPGVITAYKLERDVAKYPRILVDDKVREEIWGYHKGGIWNRQLLKKDHDGCWYLNLLTPSQSSWKPISNVKTNENVKSHLKSVRHSLLRSWKRVQNDPGHKSKVRWMIHQFNQAAADYKIDRID